QPNKILLLGQQLRLEPVQRRRQRRTPVRDLRRPDQTERRVSSESLRIVEVLITRQAAVDRLPQQVREDELPVQALSGILQVLADQRLHSQTFIQLAHQKEACVRRDARPLERHLQKAIERELKRLQL